YTMDIPVITTLRSSDDDFDAALNAGLNRGMLGNPELNQVVEAILHDVRERGDAAVLDYTRRFDRFDADAISDLCVAREQMQTSLQRLPQTQGDALRRAAERIRDYHERQKQGSWQYQDADGSIYEQKVSPIERAG